jgi:hypothetical protein
VLAACGGKSAEECRTEATEVGDLLVEAAKEPGSLFWLTDSEHLVTRTDLPVPRDWTTGPTIKLTAATTTFGDHVMADAAAIATRARETSSQIEADLATGRLRPQWVKEPRRVYLMIDPATPWDRVVGAVDALAEGGLSAPMFLFEQPTPVKAPPRAPIDDKLDKTLQAESGERATELAKLAKQVVEGCEPLKQEFGSVSAVEGENKAMRLARAVAPALIACKCNVNIPNLRAVMFRVIWVPRPIRGIGFSPDAGAQPIALPKTTTWAEASKRFTPTLGNAKLIAN